MNRKLSMFLCLIVVFTLVTNAEESAVAISGPSTIDSVTVYQHRAMIVRSISGNVVPGSYTWEFRDLPAQLLDESVRVSGRGVASAKILDIRIKRALSAESVRDAIKSLEAKMEDIDGKIQAVADHLDVLSKKGEFVRGLAVLKTGDDQDGSARPRDGSDEWRKRLDFIDSELTRIFEQNRRLSAEKRELEKKKSVLQYELKQQSGLQTNERKIVFVDVDVTKAGTERVEISYVVLGVTWTPSYDLRIGSAKGEAILACQALMNQATGEDWTNVQLSLSTSEPALESRPQQLQAWLVNTAKSELGAITCLVTDMEGLPLPGADVTVTSDVFRKTAVTNAGGRAVFYNLKPGSYDLRAELAGFRSLTRHGIEVRAGRSAQVNIELLPSTIEEEVTVIGKSISGYVDIPAAAAPEEEEEDMEAETAEAVDKAVSAVFNLKQRQTIPSSSDQKKVTIAVESLPVEKEYLSVPKLAESVSLVANITNSTGFPLLPGRASVFYDDDYVSSASVPLVSANDRFSVSVGAVPGVKIQWKLLDKKRTETGLVGKKVHLTYEIGIMLENLRDQSQTVLVKDQIPVTTSKDVTIEILQVSPEPLKTAVPEGEAGDGGLSWSITLQPLEKKEITLKFQITHPKNSPLIDWND